MLWKTSHILPKTLKSSPKVSSTVEIITLWFPIACLEKILLGSTFSWQIFCQNLLWASKSFEIHIRECKWVKYQYTLLLFYLYRIIKAIFNRLNLRLSVLKKNCVLDKMIRQYQKSIRASHVWLSIRWRWERFFLALYLSSALFTGPVDIFVVKRSQRHLLAAMLLKTIDWKLMKLRLMYALQ